MISGSVPSGTVDVLKRIAGFIRKSEGLSLVLTGVDSESLFRYALSLPEMVEGFPPKVSDMLVLDTRGEDIGIDLVRSVVSFLSYSPEVCFKKYVVIRDLDRMTQQAANALLKTLEEPPPYSVIISTTVMWHYLLPTVRSRVVRFNMPPERLDIDDPWLRSCAERDSRVLENEGKDLKDIEDVVKTMADDDANPRELCLAMKRIVELLKEGDRVKVVERFNEISKALSGKDSFRFLKRLALSTILLMESREIYDIQTLRFMDIISRSKISNYNVDLTLMNIILRIRELTEIGA